MQIAIPGDKMKAPKQNPKIGKSHQKNQPT